MGNMTPGDPESGMVTPWQSGEKDKQMNLKNNSAYDLIEMYIYSGYLTLKLFLTYQKCIITEKKVLSTHMIQQ